MAGTGIHSFAKHRSQIPRIATTGIAPWQATLKWTADCQSARSFWQEYMQSGQACRNPFSNMCRGFWQSARRLFYSWHSAAHIWARSLAKDWLPAPTILHQESPCLKRHIFLPRDFLSIKYLRGGLFRPKLYTNGLSWYTFLVALYL
jgi:hypothetical protein